MKTFDNWGPTGGRLRSYRNNAWRNCIVTKVGRVNIKASYHTPRRGRCMGGSRFEPTIHPNEVRLCGGDLDRLVASRTAFKNFSEMVNAKGGYSPTISPRDAWDYVMIGAYNEHQRSRKDPRRVYMPGAVKSFRDAEAAADLWAARRQRTEVWA